MHVVFGLGDAFIQPAYEDAYFREITDSGVPTTQNTVYGYGHEYILEDSEGAGELIRNDIVRAHKASDKSQK